MLIRALFQKFIVYMMNNLCAKFGCHISSNNRDEQGVESAPPSPGIECFKSPRSDRVKNLNGLANTADTPEQDIFIMIILQLGLTFKT